MECTVSTEEGRTWQEYLHGTKSRIVLPCPHCRVWVSPEREHLTGWQGAESQAAARSAGAFSCPACGEFWSPDDRTEANRRAKLLHEEQTIDETGVVHGDPPASDTLGFRWSAINNLFLSPGDLAVDEWRSNRAPDEENAEREMLQFVWCLPVAPAKWEETALVAHELAARMIDLPRGIVPTSAQRLTAAVDLGKYLAHWILVAWSPGAVGHIVDYGRLEVASEDLGVEKGILLALREFRDLATTGWPVGTAAGKRLVPHQIWIDAGYMTPIVYTFCREAGDRFRPALGRGAAQQHRQWYNRPTHTGSIVRHIGEGYHFNWQPSEQLYVAEVDADYWKTWVHQRLSTPLDRGGAMTLFQTAPEEHLALAKHLTAEKKTEQFVAGKGVVAKWERLRRQNHWFDALYNACAAGQYCGVRLVEETPKPAKPRPALRGFMEASRSGHDMQQLHRW